MKDEILIRPAVENDTGSILDLMKTSLGKGTIPREVTYWTWKHVRNPFGISPILVAERRGQLVGLRVFMRWTWIRQGTSTKAVRAVDTATHPDWQGRGIFTRLTLALVETMKAEGVSFIFNTPNRFSRPGYLKMGWSSVGRASLWVRPNRPLHLLRLALNRGDHPRVTEVRYTPALETEFQISDHVSRGELAELLERRGDSKLSSSLTFRYLWWRYVEIPGFVYHAMGSWKGGEEGLIIFRICSRKGLTELRLCEVLSSPGRAAVRRVAALIQDVIGVARPDVTVAMGAPGTPERRALIEAGFLPAPRVGPILTVRPLTESTRPGSLLKRADWRLSIGDLEIF